MTTTVLVFGLILIVLNVVRPLLMRLCTTIVSSEFTATFVSIWMSVGVIISLPLFYPLLMPEKWLPYWSMITVSVIKGVAMWIIIRYQQDVYRESASAGVFTTFLIMALGSLIINIFFDENLPYIDLVAMVLMGVLGVVYLYKGDFHRMSKKGKLGFYLVVMLTTYCMVADHLSIRVIGWYPHLVITTVVMYVISLMRGISFNDYKKVFTNGYVALAGAVFMVGDFFIIYSSINIMPVSYVALFTRIASVVVMLLSAKLYKEQTLEKQAAFGLIALALAAVIIFA